MAGVVPSILLGLEWWVYGGDKVEAVFQVAQRTCRIAGPRPLLKYLSLAMRLVRTDGRDEAAFKVRARQEPAMPTFLDEIHDQALAEGEARGKAEGKAAAIRHLLAKGRIGIDDARAEIRELIVMGDIPSELGQEALAKLG